MAAPKPLKGKELEDYQRWFRAWWEVDYSWDAPQNDWLRKEFTCEAFSEELTEDCEQPVFEFTHGEETRKFTRYHYPLYTYEGEPTKKNVYNANVSNIKGSINNITKSEYIEKYIFHHAISAKDYHENFDSFDVDKKSAKSHVANISGISLLDEIFLMPGFSPIDKPDRGEVILRVIAECCFFSREVCFSHWQFLGPAIFRKSIFLEKANFSRVKILGYADFSDSLFLRGLDCYEGEFGSVVNFSRVDFRDDAIFLHSQFYGQSSFSGAKFSKLADFGTTEFGGNFQISCAQFEGAVLFSDAKFQMSAEFQSCLFYSGVTFSGAEFGGVTNFDCSAFVSTVDFGHNQSTNRNFSLLSMRNAIFLATVNFNNCQFSEATEFSKTWFMGVAKFHNSVLHKDTALTIERFALPPLNPDTEKHGQHLTDYLPLFLASFLDFIQHVVLDLLKYSWVRSKLPNMGEQRKHILLRARNSKAITPEQRAIIQQYIDDHGCRTHSEREVDENGGHSKTAEEFERAFRTLKNHMEQARDRTAEQQFFAYELQSRVRRDDVKILEKWAAQAYGALSGYGASLVRPLSWLFWLSFTFTFVYWWFFGKIFGFWQALSMSVQVSMPLSLGFYPLRKVNSDDIVNAITGEAEGASHALTILGKMLLTGTVTVHAFLALVLWFLFALALRRKFQIS